MNIDSRGRWGLQFGFVDQCKQDKYGNFTSFDSGSKEFQFIVNLRISNYLKPKKTILTNLHTDLDYNFLKKNLPSNIVPAYDGMTLNL